MNEVCTKYNPLKKGLGSTPVSAMQINLVYELLYGVAFSLG